MDLPSDSWYERASDGDLMTAYVHEQDAAAFAVIYERYAADVEAVCRDILRDPTTAADIAQETFLRAARYASRFDPSRPLWPWLRQVAVNRCRSHLKGARRVVPVSFGEAGGLPEPPDPSPSDEFVADGIALAGYVRDLPPLQRTAIRLRYVEDLSRHQIADAMAISVNYVDQLVHRGRARLRRHADDLRGVLAPVFGPLVARLRTLAARTRAWNWQAQGAVAALDPVAAAVTALAVALAVAGPWRGGPGDREAPDPGVSVASGTTDGTTERARPAGRMPDVPGSPLRRDPAGTDDPGTQVALDSRSVVDTGLPAAGRAEVGRDRSEDRTTLSRWVEARLGEDGPWHDYITEFHCEGSAVREAACSVAREVDRLPPPPSDGGLVPGG